MKGGPQRGEAQETVLVIEDDPSIRAGLLMNLRAEGYRVLSAGDSPNGLRLCRQERPDLVLLDLMLPGGSGLDLLAALRDGGLQMPVLILTALGRQQEIVRGLRCGADDYITKPFDLGELLARAQAALRRKRIERQARDEARVQVGRVQIQESSGQAWRDGEPLRLTGKELDLLLVLARRPERVYSRGQLLDRVWGQDYEGTDRTVDNFICALRAKVEPDPGQPRHLVTVRGRGYMFSP